MQYFVFRVHEAMKDGRAYRDRLDFESHIFFDGATRGIVLNDFVLQVRTVYRREGSARNG